MALADNLIAYWSCDEASGAVIDAHAANDLADNNTVGAGTGIISGGRDYEASTTEFSNIADNTDLSTGDIDFTIAGWVNAESLGADRVIIGKVTSGGTTEYVLRYQNSASRFQWRVSHDGGTMKDRAFTTLGAPGTATWYFLVCWHDSVNNVTGVAAGAGGTMGSADTVAHTTGVLNGTGGFVFGREGDKNADYWDGIIDEVGFWKRVLTADERTELYNSGAGRDYAYIIGGAATNRRRRVLMSAA